MSRQRIVIVVLGLLFVALFATGCGSPNDTPNPPGTEVAGFWNGLWDGFTAWFAFIFDLVGLGEYNIYEVHNNGGWYNFGFLLGIGVLLGGGERTVYVTRN